MKNIFANAKWGDTFRTYSNKKCIFLGFVPDMSYVATVENQAWTLEYNADGTLREALRKNDDDYHHPLDIVSKWEETIDEKKLQKLAEECTPKMLKEEGDTNEFEWGFKVGFRKAKED